MIDGVGLAARLTARLRQRRTAARWLMASLLGLVLAGCASPRTTVVLLPDEDGHVGSVSVSGAGSSRRLDRALSTATVGGSGPVGIATLAPEALRGSYRQLLLAQPTKPEVFVLQFLLGKAELTPESKAQIPAVLAAARARKPTEISVFGHADAIGSDQRNVRLSAERAEAVARLLRASDASIGEIELRWFGSTAPLEPSDSRGAQPKNRRAEVMIL